MTVEPAPRRAYAKPVVLPESLDDLRGPTSGVVYLPRHLKWSGSARYDLDTAGRIMDMYRTVLNEAVSVDDLGAFLDRGALLDLWESMWLPDPVRQAWESRFHVLAVRRATV
jgi:hypothetical protein